jgi:hypothetical protein
LRTRQGREVLVFWPWGWNYRLESPVLTDLAGWGGTIWPSGPRFLLHDEPHTLGYPGRGKSFVLAGKKEGHRQAFHQGGKDERVLADDRFL